VSAIQSWPAARAKKASLAWVLKRQHWLAVPGFLFLGVGWYLHNVAQAAVIVSIPGKNPARALIVTVVDGLILFLLLRQIRRGGV
jgi:hypothetical protein